ncbi:MAG: hypothetical protein QM757_06680 [Paludibaculum sp.]
MWWMFCRVGEEIPAVLPEFSAVRHEPLAFRSILGLTFDAMEDEKVMYGEAEASRLRHDILGPLNVASGFLELLAMELPSAGNSPAAEYLSRARDGVARAIAIAITIGSPASEVLEDEDSVPPGSADRGSTEGRS